MARAKHCVATALLALQFLQSGPALFARDVSGDTAYESDLEYILTNYYILGNYEEVIRLLNKHHSGCQRELAYLYGLCYLESVHNVDTLWTDFLKNRIFAAFRRENARSVHKVTDFVDRHYLKLNMNKIAIDYFTVALEDNENNYEILNNIGAAYFQDNDYINAMKYFHLSFVANTGYDIARENYNAAYEGWVSKRENGSIGPVIPFTEKPTLYNSLGWFYYYSGDFHNAVYYFKKAIDEDEKYQFAYIALAYIYDEENNFEAALDYLRDAEKIDENNPDMHNNLGVVYFHLSDYENSENAFKKAMALNRRFAEPCNNLGFLYFEKGEYDLSEEYFKKSLDLNPGNKSLRAESMAGLAVIAMKNNNNDQSRAYKESAARLDYRIGNRQYVTQKLQWSDEFIAAWGSIPFP